MATLAMPPNEECPNCHRNVEDWHVEWYKTETRALYQGLAAMDCPLCGQPVGFQGGVIGLAPPGATGATVRGESGRVGGLAGRLRGGNTARLYILGGRGRSVCWLLDSARRPAGRLK